MAAEGRDGTSAELDVYKEWLGIPEGPRPPDHYELLRLVQFEDDVEKIQQHYKKLNAHVRKYASGQYSARSQELLNELAKAMLCLTDPQRKREYDESLGRTFEDEDRFGPQPLEQVLVDQGHLSRDQVSEVRSFAEARGLSMRDAVVQMKLVDAETAARALAQELGLSYVDLSETIPDDSVLDQVPRNLVKRHTILPLFADDEVLLVACADQPDPELEDDLRLRFGIPMRPVLATPRAVNQAIAKYYAPGARDESAVREVSPRGKGGKKQARPARKRFSRLSPEEQRERRQYGILFICWAFIGSALLDQFLLRGTVIDPGWMFPFNHFLLTFLVTPAVALWVFLSYWK